MKSLVTFLIKIFSAIYSYNASRKAANFFNIFYSIWIKINFKKYGSAYIQHPAFIHGAKYISIGDKFAANRQFRIEAIDSYNRGEAFMPEIIIGNNVSFNVNCHIGAIDKIIIKDNVLVGSNVLITDHSHGTATLESIADIPLQRKLYSKGPVIIEENVWIGENVSILPGVTIGKNSIIGANSVVTKSVPSNAVVAGNPAKILKLIS